MAFQIVIGNDPAVRHGRWLAFSFVEAGASFRIDMKTEVSHNHCFEFTGVVKNSHASAVRRVLKCYNTVVDEQKGTYWMASLWSSIVILATYTAPVYVRWGFAESPRALVEGGDGNGALEREFADFNAALEQVGRLHRTWLANRTL